MRDAIPAWVAGEVLHVGAEAVATSGRWLDGDAVLKERRPRAYRHPSLDRRLSSMRATAEARILLRLASARFATQRFPAPVLLAMDADAGWMIQSRMLGAPLFESLREEPLEGMTGDIGISTLEATTERWIPVMNQLGVLIRALHGRGISHGDLTTHNILWSAESGLSLVDFGLGQLSPELEICGLDLQVLAECLQASHPNLKGAMQAVLAGYSSGVSECEPAEGLTEQSTEKSAEESVVSSEDCTDGPGDESSLDTSSSVVGQILPNLGGSTVHSAAEVVGRFDEIRSRVRYHG